MDNNKLHRTFSEKLYRKNSDKRKPCNLNLHRNDLRSSTSCSCSSDTSTYSFSSSSPSSSSPISQSHCTSSSLSSYSPPISPADKKPRSVSQLKKCSQEEIDDLKNGKRRLGKTQSLDVVSSSPEIQNHDKFAFQMEELKNCRYLRNPKENETVN